MGKDLDLWDLTQEGEPARAELLRFEGIEEAAKKLIAADDAWVHDWENPRARAAVVHAKVCLREAIDIKR